MTVKRPPPNSHDDPDPDRVRSPEPYDVEDRLQRLTSRQKACLRLARPDFSSKLIGKELGISHRSVDNNIRAALNAVGLKSRFEAGQRLRALERAQTLAAPAETVGDQSVGLPTDPDSSSGDAADGQWSDVPPADHGAPAETTEVSDEEPLHEPEKHMQSEANERRRPPLIALAITIIAILAAIGALAALLLILDWASRT